MSENPVWRESMEIYFAEGHGFAVYFYLLIILAPVEFLSLYIPSLDAQMWSGSASLFKVTAVTTLVLVVYFSLRVANQEFAPWRFKSLKTWLRDEGLPAAMIRRAQLGFLCVHIGLSLLLCGPSLRLGRGDRAHAAIEHHAHFFAPAGLRANLRRLGVGDAGALGAPSGKPPGFHSLLICGFGHSLALFYLPLNPIAFLLAT